MLQKQLNRHSSSLVHKLKRKFFPEEFTPVSPTSDKNTDASGDSDSPLARDYIPPKNVEEQIYTLYQVSTRDVNAMSVIVDYLFLELARFEAWSFKTAIFQGCFKTAIVCF